MLTTRALDAPHPLGHNVIGEGLHWLHAVAQPDTAIINPRLAAIIVDGHVLRFVPIAWGGAPPSSSRWPTCAGGSAEHP